MKHTLPFGQRIHRLVRRASWAMVGLTGPLAATSGCGNTIDCEALCARTLACEVTFDAPDDPSGQKIEDGTRTDENGCLLGCEAHPLVNETSAACIDGLDTRDPSVCQDEVLACFEVSPAT